MMSLGGPGGLGNRKPDERLPDYAETVYISSLALLKMLKHGRAGIPVEVMGLMLGSFVDVSMIIFIIILYFFKNYTVNVVDVFSMPQIGTGVSVETVDEGFQLDMLDMLVKTG
jgi:26S proteasome regulatory subunit N11